MKALVLPTLLLTSTFFSLAQNTAIPDANFEQYLIDSGLDTGTPDGTVLTANISSVTELFIQDKNIADLTGIADFAALEILRCDGNLLTSLDLSQNTDILWVLCSDNQLSAVNLTDCSNLYYFVCANNNLTTLSLAGNTSLAELDCSQNSLTGLNLSNSPVLTKLNCRENNLTVITVTGNALLGTLNCADNMLAAIDISQNGTLVTLDVSGNLLSSLDCHDNPVLNRLLCSNNSLQCLNVRNGNNQSFFEFDATGNSSLTCIEVDDTAWSNDNWTNIDAGAQFSELCGNSCSSNQLGIAEPMANRFDVYPNPVTGSIIYISPALPGDMYTLYHLSGQAVQSGTVQSGQIMLDEKPAPGIYLIGINNENQASQVFQKVVID